MSVISVWLIALSREAVEVLIVDGSWADLPSGSLLEDAPVVGLDALADAVADATGTDAAVVDLAAGFSSVGEASVFAVPEALVRQIAHLDDRQVRTVVSTWEGDPLVDRWIDDEDWAVEALASGRELARTATQSSTSVFAVLMP